MFMFLFVLEPLPVHGSSTIVFDFSPATTKCVSLCSSLTWSHTVGSGSNRILIVGLSSSVSASPPSVTFGAASLTLLGNHADAFTNVQVELWSLLNPPIGTATIRVTFSSPIEIVVGDSVSYFNVAGTGTVASADDGGPVSSSASVAVSGSSSGDLVVDTLALFSTSGSTTGSPGSGQTSRWNSGPIFLTGTDYFAGAGSDKPDSPPVTMSWSFSNPSLWSLIAVPLTPAGPPIPEYPLGLPILSIFMIVGYGLIRRKTITKQK
jgi:hypothetical protein